VMHVANLKEVPKLKHKTKKSLGNSIYLAH
jgi:hypothetical protein